MYIPYVFFNKSYSKQINAAQIFEIIKHLVQFEYLFIRK